MKILTSDEVRRAEREAIKKQDLSTLLLMQRAGFTVAAPDTTWSLIPSLGYGVAGETL